MLEPAVVQPAAQARLAANALRLGRGIERWSLALTLLAFAVLWVAPPGGWWPQLLLLLSIALGGIGKLYALRVAFDAAVFAGWADSWAASADPLAPRATLENFDAALAACGWRAIPAEGRELDRRLAGAFRLLRRQLLIFATQFLLGLAALLASGLPVEI